MSTETSVSPNSDRATPRVDRRRPGLQKSDTAVRACIGRYTVDIVSTPNSVLALVGDGVGRPPVSAEIGPAVVAAVLDAAASVDERTAWETQAWPLTR